MAAHIFWFKDHGSYRSGPYWSPTVRQLKDIPHGNEQGRRVFLGNFDRAKEIAQYMGGPDIAIMWAYENCKRLMEYKIEDAAARLLALGRITESPSDETVRRWCREGRFPHAHKKEGTRGQGGSWRIPEADLLRFVQPRPGPKGPRRKG